jgi:hypothetical protein
MQKDKHNIYSKEELLKLIKEGKSVPADMDEFDREALEGLKLLDKPDVLNKLDAEVDSIIAKENKKKTIYYFSAAASLLLIICLVFLFKNEFVTKNEKPIASAESLKKPEELTPSNTTPVQPEAQTTYEAKEPEASAKQTLSNKVSESRDTSKPAPSPILADEKEHKAKDADNQLEAMSAQSKADNYEESKVAAPQINQEQQVVATNGVETQNNAISDNDDANEKSKKKREFVTANTIQPTQAASAKANVPTSVPAAEKDEASSKNQTIKLSSYAGISNKKTDTKNYKEPSFIGGDTMFAAYVKQNLKISSPSNSGIIVVEFLVTKTGKAEKIKILKPLNGCDTCSQDVVDLIKSIKKWAPATIDGNNSDAFKKTSIQYN